MTLDTLYQKQCGYITFSCIGFLLMIFGFFRWHHKEQKIRDQMLVIEHAIKVLDKTYYREDRTKRNVEPEVAQSLFKREGPEKN